MVGSPKRPSSLRWWRVFERQDPPSTVGDGSLVPNTVPRSYKVHLVENPRVLFLSKPSFTEPEKGHVGSV